MHPQSPPLTIGGTVLKEYDDLVVLGVTFDSKMTFEKHLRSVSKAASQRLGILKSCRVFHDRSPLVRCFLCFVLRVLEYCSAGLCFAANTHFKLLYRTASGARFLTGSVFEFDFAHRRSMTVLCMLYKIRCNMMFSCNGDLPRPYVPVQVTPSALIAHRYTYALPRCRTSQHLMTFILLSVSLKNDLADTVFDGVGLADFKSRANTFLLALAALSLL